MATLTPLFEQTFHEAAPFICGIGTLLPGHTLILIQTAATDSDSYATTTDTLNGVDFTLDGVASLYEGTGGPSLETYVESYINYSGVAIDLTNAISINYASGVDYAMAVKAFTIDAVVVDKYSTNQANQISGYVIINQYASDETTIEVAGVGTYDDPANWDWVDDGSNFQTEYTPFGIVDNTNAPGSTALISLGAFDWIGLAGADTTRLLKGNIPLNYLTRYYHGAVFISYEVVETVFYLLSDPLALSIELAARPEVGAELKVALEIYQPYYLSLLETTFTQPYSQTIERDWTQTYGELQPVENEVVDAPYKLGFDDVSAQITQTYSGYLEFDIDQPYTQLQPVAKELNVPYKLGFDEVSGQVVQPYTLFIEAEFVQAYGDVIVAAAEINQPYITSIPVEAEIVSTYDFIAGNFVSMNLTSHYTMYSSDNVVVINTSSGLVYKSGYTAQPVE